MNLTFDPNTAVLESTAAAHRFDAQTKSVALTSQLYQLIEQLNAKQDLREQRMKRAEELVSIAYAVSDLHAMEMDGVGFIEGTDIQRIVQQSKVAGQRVNVHVDSIDSTQLREVVDELLVNYSEQENGQKVQPDDEIYNKIFDLIANVESSYVTPYQEVAEILADMYSAFSELNTVVTKMISNGVPNKDGSAMTLDMTELKTAVDNLVRTFTETNPGYPNSRDSIAIRLKNIQFSAADEAKARELIEGTGLILVNKEDGSGGFYLFVDLDLINNLNEAVFALSKNAEVTTYQLQSFDTAFKSIGEQYANNMQTGAQKYQRTISQQDNFTKLLSTFMQANADANKGFLA
ncbi:IpaD/SipD/SspD family type III secretion system needle tip protein [Vibrio misgurnus]|uniref:IpaD/SipD/SspD family type III secretion system needle tip protein n=1 Tax=Vibrio misgurnus TaxID=2993714 RepID=UPI0023F9773A|nr:IpaD/SipD/SspD family type III secretion system needle tip protein [Vibrio sp. VCS]